MFTGIVEEVGRVMVRAERPDGARLRVKARAVLEGLALGDSVSVDGACLTVVAIHEDGFEVDAVAETLSRTGLGDRSAGDGLNLERARRVGDRLDGHIVQGHVDGTGFVAEVTMLGTGCEMRIAAAPEIMRYVVEKGSITVDGVSLTVATRHADGMSIALIPHTLSHTTLGSIAVGHRANLEVDVLAKYVEALVAPYRGAEGSA